MRHNSTINRERVGTIRAAGNLTAKQLPGLRNPRREERLIDGNFLHDLNGWNEFGAASRALSFDR